MNSKTSVAFSVAAIAAVISLFASGPLAATKAQAFGGFGFGGFGGCGRVGQGDYKGIRKPVSRDSASEKGSNANNFIALWYDT